jgi:hypothetical protein
MGDDADVGGFSGYLLRLKRNCWIYNTEVIK